MNNLKQRTVLRSNWNVRETSLAKVVWGAFRSAKGEGMFQAKETASAEVLR